MRVRAHTCENPFREGEGRCQTVFFAGRTKSSKKHVARGKKIEKEVTRRYIQRAKREQKRHGKRREERGEGGNTAGENSVCPFREGGREAVNLDRLLENQNSL